MEDFPFSCSFQNLVPSRTVEHLGKSDLTFEGKLPNGLVINEDGGESGCGGKVWIAGELLCEYILEKSHETHLLEDVFPDRNFKRVLELGSGTGLVGLCVGVFDKMNKHVDREVFISDVDQLLSLMDQNIKSNKLEEHVHAQKLNWGEVLPLSISSEPIDLVLAADCVYLEAAFPLLEQTLLDLTAGDAPPVVLMSYRKRRKADKHFFQLIRRNFEVREISDYDKYASYVKQRTHLFQLIRNVT